MGASGKDDPSTTADASPPTREGKRREAPRGVDGDPSFGSKDLLAGRYFIRRFIARGGMGEVYEALDNELREIVALKTIRPSFATNPAVLARFLREIQLARKVTHPNVCRLFDLERHSDGTPFLTMELLEGENLSERLARGPLGVDEALPIVREMAAGLEAAHLAGVIHRDFKPSNVFLSSTSGGPRVVVTDFGVARSLGDDGEAAMTRTGDTVGSPAYMAPEQVEGKEVTPATDVYALGVTMFEMVTGHRPFEGGSVSTTVRRLNEAAPSPRMHVPDLPPRWEDVILRCLERNPSRRYPSAGEVVRALGEGGGPSRRAIRSRLLVAVGTVAAVLLVYPIHLRYQAWTTRKPAGVGVGTEFASSSPAGARIRRSIAVVGLRNVSDKSEMAWIRTAVAELLTTELAAGDQVRLVPGENVARMQLESSLHETDSLNASTLTKIRAALGADLIVLGSYAPIGKGRLRLELRLQETKDGSTLAVVAETGQEDELVDLVTRAGSQLRSKLGIGALSEAEVGELRQALPTNAEAAKLYAEGLGKLRRFDALGAQALLERALGLDPNHAPIHSAMASTWAALGYDERAKVEAKRAFDLSASLGREDRLWTEALYREAAKEWDTAVGVYRALQSFFPDNLEYSLRLVAASTSAGKGKEALQTLAAVRNLGGLLAEDPRIDLSEAQAHKSLGDTRMQIEAARRAASKGRALGAHLLEARAYLEEGWAHFQLSEYDKALAANERARGIFARAGDALGEAEAVRGSASLTIEQDDPTPALRMFEEALALYRRIGNEAGIAACENGLGLVAARTGHFRESARQYEAAVARTRRTGNKRGLAFTLSNLMDAATLLGDFSRARQAGEEALRLAEGMENKALVVFVLSNVAVLEERTGDLKQADEGFNRVIRLRRQLGNQRDVATSLVEHSVVLRCLADLTRARQAVEEAMRIEMGTGVARAQTLFAAAILEFEEGRLTEALRRVRESTSRARESKVADYESRSLSLEVRVLGAAGRWLEARSVLDRATEVAKTSDAIDAQLEVMLATSQVVSAEGKAKQAVAILEEVIAKAEQLRYARPALEASLAIGRIELASNVRLAKERLVRLSHHAEGKGFYGISRQAASASVGQR